MKPYHAIPALTLAISLLAPCPALPAAGEKKDLEAIAGGNNEFAFEIYRKLAAPGKNLFISPLSISTAFAMAGAGARGSTRDEIDRVLRFPGSGEVPVRAWGGFLAQLQERAKEGRYRLSVANRVWVGKKFAIGKDYSKTMKKSFNAGLRQVDFAGDPEGARGDINDWVARQTAEKITGLIPEGAITGATALVLTNAVYFLGSWKKPFDEKATSQAEFIISPAKRASVPMMKNTGIYRFAEYDDVSALELPYRAEGNAGGALSMIVILPKKAAGLADIEKKMGAAAMKRWADGMGEREVVVELPRFEVTSTAGLSEPLQALGMKAAFTPDADFSGIAPKLYISEAFHKAYVSVNEKGTEAAAATAILMVKANGGKKLHFRADHPFLFAIRDTGTGAILFIGRVVDPLAK